MTDPTVTVVLTNADGLTTITCTARIDPQGLRIVTEVDTRRGDARLSHGTFVVPLADTPSATITEWRLRLQALLYSLGGLAVGRRAIARGVKDLTPLLARAAAQVARA